MIKNKRMKSFMALSAMAFAILVSSCDVHQFPEPSVTPDSPDNPVLPEETVKVPLRLVFNPDFYVWEHDYDPISGKIQEKNPDLEIFPGYLGVSDKYDNTLPRGIMDVTVKAYLYSNSSNVVKEVSKSMILAGDSYDMDINLDLPKDTKYRLVVWSHLREFAEANPFYDASNFNKVSIIGDNFKGSTDYRDAFSGVAEITTFSEFGDRQLVEMTRPMGKFEMVTIDLSEFLDRETTRRGLATRAEASDYIVMISFPYYYPSSYSVGDDRLENASSGVSFRSHMTVTGETVASLGFDYVLLNDTDDSGVQARVDVYDPSYSHVAGSTTLTIPMRRDHHTVLKGEFLSTDNEGGVGLDPGFNGDHNVIS